MKSFKEYVDGEWVVYYNPGHSWHLMQFQAYKSKYTEDAFRLKYGAREVVADISEIRPLTEINQLLKGDHEDTNRDIQHDVERSGIYGIED